MNYLVIKNNTITQVCTSAEDLLEYLEVNVTDEGVVEITNDGRQLPTSYNMKEFTKEEHNEINETAMHYMIKGTLPTDLCRKYKIIHVCF